MRRPRSRRLPPDLTPNAVSLALAERRASGHPLIDLTLSNPTQAGLPYPADLLAPLADPAGLQYEPEPLGRRAAREAVAADFARRGHGVSADCIALTASTSEAYAHLFTLLCDPGDEVLVPRPSYPLFDHLTAFQSVTAVPYDVEYHGHWQVDVGSVQRALSARTRALLVVSPNNPTGSWLQADELSALSTLCAARGLMLIGDEVFADYPLESRPGAVSVLAQRDVLTVALGGLSKSIGLPQVKLGWMAVQGPDAEVHEFLQAYELVADTYLSVSTPVQVAAPALLARGAVVRAAIQSRTVANLQALDAALMSLPSVTRLPVEGGWCAVLQVPATDGEEALVLRLLQDDGVLVHPGYFFDFPREAFVVVSLLPETEVFTDGVRRMLARVMVR